MADDYSGIDLPPGNGDRKKTRRDANATLCHVDLKTVIESKSLSAGMDESFWLALMWLFIVAALAVSANLWSLPEYDHMDWHHQAASPGTRSRVPIKDCCGKTTETTFVYLLGTDTMGRDVLTRLIFGARVSLMVGLAPPCIGMLIGGILGMLAGFYRGLLGTCIMVAMDGILSFPGIVLLLVIAFYLGPGLGKMILALGFLTIPHFSRVARANTLKVASWEFITSARMIGQSDASIMLREIAPNIAIPLIVYALLVVAYMIVAEGVLSFLGLGVPAPTPSWGSMIAEGKEVLEESAHISLLPALVMFLTVLAFNVIGDGLKNVLDEKEGQL